MRWSAFALAGVAGMASSARADHTHHAAPDVEAARGEVTIALVAARYDTELYSGDYQGLAVGGAWRPLPWLVVDASLPGYRLELNGLHVDGLGDPVAGARVEVARRGAAALAVGLHASTPVGDDRVGLGMGHWMTMASLSGTRTVERVAVGVAVGYGRALGGDHGHDHGAWPLVDPMNAREVTADANVAYDHRVARAAVRLGGALPVGGGERRGQAAASIGRAFGPWSAAVELEVREPFTVRAAVRTALRF